MNVKVYLCFVSSILISTEAIVLPQGCDNYYQMESNGYYYIQNPQYDKYYQGGWSCRWREQALRNAQILLRCSVVDVPCSTDSLLITPGGGGYPVEWCGTGARNELFNTNFLSIELKSSTSSRGGRFSCESIALGGSGPPITTPTTTTTTTPSTPQCDCGWRQMRKIVGGQETDVNEYAFMAGLVDISQRIVFCGGSIISSWAILTAAHCKRNMSAVGVLVGDHDIDTGNDTPYTVLYKIQRMIIHEDYNNFTNENDIALVITSQEIQFSIAVGPICLPYYLWATDGLYDVTVTGWGTDEYSGRSSDVLMEVNLTTLTLPDCRSRLASSVIHESQICTFKLDRDACQYDSGGPLFWFDPTRQRFKLIGLVSYGWGCASSKPSINTRVRNFINWIEWHTGTGYCKK